MVGMMVNSFRLFVSYSAIYNNSAYIGNPPARPAYWASVILFACLLFLVRPNKDGCYRLQKHDVLISGQ